MSKITFYHNPMSRGRIAHWMLEEIGEKYETKIIDFKKKENRDPAFLKINPMGKIPTIVHGDIVISEAAAICTYLADAFPEKKLAPPLTDPRRGTYLRWLFFGAGCVEPAIVDKLFKRPPVDPPSALGYGSYEDTVKTLEYAVGGSGWILGDQFSAADVYIGSQIQWGFMSKGLEETPILKSYLERCMQRPALQRISKDLPKS